MSRIKTRVGPVLIPAEDMDALREFAARHDRTLSGEMRRAIRVYVEHVRRTERIPAPEQAAQNSH